MDRAELRKKNSERRDKAVLEMVNHLYTKKRLRYDDVIAKVADNFFLSEITVNNILKRNKEDKKDA